MRSRSNIPAGYLSDRSEDQSRCHSLNGCRVIGVGVRYRQTAWGVERAQRQQRRLLHVARKRCYRASTRVTWVFSGCETRRGKKASPISRVCASVNNPKPGFLLRQPTSVPGPRSAKSFSRPLQKLSRATHHFFPNFLPYSLQPASRPIYKQMSTEYRFSLADWNSMHCTPHASLSEALCIAKWALFGTRRHHPRYRSCHLHDLKRYHSRFQAA